MSRLSISWIWILSFAPLILSQSDKYLTSGADRIVLRKGIPLVLSCSPEHLDNQIVDVTWLLGDEAIDVEDSHYTLFENKTLSVAHPRASDAGDYTCKVEMKVGSTTKVLQKVISVQLPAFVHDFPSTSMNLMEGETLKLTCRVLGLPEPEVVWLKDGHEPVYEGNRVHLEPNERGIANAVLEISNVEPDDRGNYTCRASNDLDPDHLAEAHIFIRVKDQLAALWPFLGICLQVFVVCVIILIYEKKRNKEVDEDEPPPK